MPSANALWRGYVRRNQRSRRSTLRTGTIIDDARAANAIGGSNGEGSNAVASTMIGNSTDQRRHQTGGLPGSGGGVL